jgi:hypothetical protein
MTARRVTTTSEGATRLSNKELKLTKPSIMELRSLTPVFCGQGAAHDAQPAAGERFEME